ncbi:hypothetical protein BGZ63DRAFT_375254 [Mariannaea sp. PMI_226]|nr:hypothetical protein BGZ63DRAFT_375254 [Mariannaea sp. PMI_226]
MSSAFQHGYFQYLKIINNFGYHVASLGPCSTVERRSCAISAMDSPETPNVENIHHPSLSLTDSAPSLRCRSKNASLRTELFEFSEIPRTVCEFHDRGSTNLLCSHGTSMERLLRARMQLRDTGITHRSILRNPRRIYYLYCYRDVISNRGNDHVELAHATWLISMPLACSGSSSQHAIFLSY